MPHAGLATAAASGASASATTSAEPPAAATSARNANTSNNNKVTTAQQQQQQQQSQQQALAHNKAATAHAASDAAASTTTTTTASQAPPADTSANNTETQAPPSPSKRSPAPFLKYGYLFKQSSGKWKRKRWNQRWFVLDSETGVLTYFRHASLPEAVHFRQDAHGALQLQEKGVTLVIQGDLPRGVPTPFCFTVSGRSGREIRICADTNQEFKEWTNAISLVMSPRDIAERHGTGDIDAFQDNSRRTKQPKSGALRESSASSASSSSSSCPPSPSRGDEDDADDDSVSEDDDNDVEEHARVRRNSSSVAHASPVARTVKKRSARDSIFPPNMVRRSCTRSCVLLSEQLASHSIALHLFACDLLAQQAVATRDDSSAAHAQPCRR